MSADYNHFIGQVAANPKKAIDAALIIVETAPVLIPVAAVVGVGYGIYRLLTNDKKKAKAKYEGGSSHAPTV